MSKYRETSLAVNKKSKIKFFNHETLRRVVLLWCQQKKGSPQTRNKSRMMSTRQKDLLEVSF